MSVPAPRQRLLDRRPHWLFRFESGGQMYTGGNGRFDDGRIAEIFINGAKVGSAAEANAQDAAIVAPWRSSTAVRWIPFGTPWRDREAQPVRWQHCWARSSHETGRASSLSHPYPLRQARGIFAWRGGKPRRQVCRYNPELVRPTLERKLMPRCTRCWTVRRFGMRR
jgi:hypothetical protein